MLLTPFLGTGLRTPDSEAFLAERFECYSTHSNWCSPAAQSAQATELHHIAGTCNPLNLGSDMQERTNTFWITQGSQSTRALTLNRSRATAPLVALSGCFWT